MKKGQAEYNWAFVIIAGAVILAFFVTFTMKYMDIQNKKENAEISKDIYNTLVALQKSSYDTEMPINIIIEKDFKFTCDEFEVGNYFSQHLKKEFVFSPTTMKTSKLDVFMKSWKYPFKIANLFYLTSNEKKYYLLFDASSSQFVNSLSFPKGFNVQKITTLPNLNDPNSRVISFTRQKADVQITPNEQGSVIINNKEYPLLGLPLVYGAILSDNYGCLLQRLLDKFSEIIDIYMGKIDYMAAMNRNCDYSALKRTLSTLKSAITSKNYDQIRQYSIVLEEQNTNLVSANCQPLY